MALARGHRDRIKTLISSLSKGFTSVLLSWFRPAFLHNPCVDGRPFPGLARYLSKLIKDTYKAASAILCCVQWPMARLRPDSGKRRPSDGNTIMTGGGGGGGEGELRLLRGRK